MVDVVVDGSGIAAMITLLIPAVGWVWTYLQKRKADHQGSMAYAKMKDRGNAILKLADKFPGAAPLAAEYRTTAVYAEQLWRSKNNSEELQATLTKGDKLLDQIFEEIGKYAPCPAADICKVR